MNTRPFSDYCDDGNSLNGDGCNESCKVEQGFKCQGATSAMRDTCTEYCGDGLDFQSFGCDDGNLIDGDG
jgi:cysteine-rich repeat protein